MFFKAKASGDSSFDPQPEAIPITTIKRIPQGTDQQESLWSALVEGDTHVLAEARAGAGKSSSCREAMWRILERHPGKRLRYAVFNKANADEFRNQCPPGVEVATSHSFGFQALKAAFRSQVEKNKTYLILDETPAGRNLPRYLRKSIAYLVSHAKNAGLNPESSEADMMEELHRLILHYDVNTYGRPPMIAGWTIETMKKSAAWTELIDFDDMLWLAAIHKVKFPPCDVLFLDEAQDFNIPQQMLIGPMSQSGRVVAVGDRFQAINIFRGADQVSLDNITEQLTISGGGFNSYPLTITFRCPKSHVRMANGLVPDLQAMESAPEGEIDEVEIPDMLDEAKAGDLVICPLNGPVISACLKVIARKRPAYVRGRAVGDQLTTVLRGCQGRTVSAVAKEIETWKNRELNRLALMDGVEDVIESVEDRFHGLQAILSVSDSPGDAETLIGQLFSDDRRSNILTFSTVHRAKGDEAETVWFIDLHTRQAKQEWERQQKRNLRYVALTRSKNRLVFVDDGSKDDPE